MAPSGHRRNLHPVKLSSSETVIQWNCHPGRTYKIGRTKHCSVRYMIYIWRCTIGAEEKKAAEEEGTVCLVIYKIFSLRNLTNK